MKRRGSIFSILLFLFLMGAATLFAGETFVGHLSGDQEVPAFDTKAQGQAIFRVRGDSLRYKLIVAAIENIVASHLHCAPPGENGPVGVTLFFGGPVTVTGILAQGPILAPNSSNGCGWADLDDVIDALRTGDTYVNVHTLQSPSGEIRGQMR